MAVTPDFRLAELLSRMSERDAYELAVLRQVVKMPSATPDDQETRLLAWRRAMRMAPQS